jgi:hypothetical protein
MQFRALQHAKCQFGLRSHRGLQLSAGRLGRSRSAVHKRPVCAAGRRHDRTHEHDPGRVRWCEAGVVSPGHGSDRRIATDSAVLSPLRRVGRNNHLPLIWNSKITAITTNPIAMRRTHAIAGINLCPQYGQTRRFRPRVCWQAGHVFITVNVFLAFCGCQQTDALRVCPPEEHCVAGAFVSG